MGKHGVFGAKRVQLPYLCYIGGESITNPDNWKVPLPTTTTVVQIATEDAECFYAIDGNFAQDNSPGRIAADTEEKIGPIGGGTMQTLHLHAPSGIVHLQYYRECGRGRIERPGFQYYEKVLNLDPIAYWPLWESSGTVAHCLVNSAQNGTYSSDVSTWPVGTGIGDGNTVPQFDGANDFVNVQTATLAAAFNGSEGTLFQWVRVANAGVWTDGTRNDGWFIGTGGPEYVIMRKDIANNQYGWLYNAGGVAESVSTGGLSTIAWVPVALTWSATADEMKAYWNGAQSGATQTVLGVWGNAITSCIIGATHVGPANVWEGWSGHPQIYNRALSLTEIQTLGTV